MKAHLMYPDRDFDAAQEASPQLAALIQDLELNSLFVAMAREDKWLETIARRAVLASTANVSTILYRQDILRDCLQREATVREMYDLTVQTIEAERKDFFGISFRNPNWVLHRSVSVLQMLVSMLQRLRKIADLQGPRFGSQGFKAFFAMLRRELSDDYFDALRQHLRRLQFDRGVLVSATLGEGNKSTNHVLRRENPSQGSWIDRLLAPRPPGYSYRLPDRDEGGSRALTELKDRGINLVASAVAQSTDHIMSLFQMLRTELAFYVGCLNLHARLTALGELVCFPQAAPSGERRLTATGLYDACLALEIGGAVVANDIEADSKDLIIITGANQGGKSTFLRSVGLAQLMMQCGMFVPAVAYCANTCERIFTHYKREEDATMNSGKLDEELSRMSDIAEGLTRDSLVLFNESFASTNEREGSEIARQVVTALIERRIKVCFVTHQYEFANGFFSQSLPNALFLRATRQDGGTRTFRLTEDAPLPTSHGEDLYNLIFGLGSGHGPTARLQVTNSSTRPSAP
jgi:MutS domain V